MGISPPPRSRGVGVFLWGQAVDHRDPEAEKDLQLLRRLDLRAGKPQPLLPAEQIEAS